MNAELRLKGLISCMDVMLEKQSVRLQFMRQYIDFLPEESRAELSGLAQLLEDSEEYAYKQRETLKMFTE